MSTRLDWEITRGDTDALAFAVTILGSTDITGAEVRCYIRDTRVASGLVTPMTALLLRNTAAGGDNTEIEITDALAGELEVKLTYDDLVDEGLTGTPGEFVRLFYSLRIVRTDGERKTCAHGYMVALIGGDA